MRRWTFPESINNRYDEYKWRLTAPDFSIKTFKTRKPIIIVYGPRDYNMVRGFAPSHNTAMFATETTNTPYNIETNRSFPRYYRIGYYRPSADVSVVITYGLYAKNRF